MTKLKVTKIPQVNAIVLRQYDGNDFFISSPDSIVLTVSSLANILLYLVKSGVLSPKVLEGILEEVRDINVE